MIVFGVGEVFGGLLFGKLVDTFGARRCIYILILVMILMLASTLNAIYIERYNWSTFVMTFLWGLQDSFYNVHLMMVLVSEFTEKSE